MSNVCSAIAAGCAACGRLATRPRHVLPPLAKAGGRSTAHPQRRRSHTGSVLVTTPIFYVNSSPHVGHLYTTLLADACARYHRLARGLPSAPQHSAGEGHAVAAAAAVTLVTGTDEHGQKVAEAARVAAASATPLPPASIASFVDGVSASFRGMGAAFHVAPDAFIRTTEPRHAAVVRWLWRRLAGRGALEIRDYCGWYCRSDEAFVPESSTLTRSEYAAKKGKGGGKGKGAPGGAVPGEETDDVRVSTDSGHPVEWVTERNYVFPLTRYRQALLDLLDAPPPPGCSAGFVYPPERAAQVRAHVAGTGLVDVSVSRPASRVPWALRVPGDDSQSVYVWLDALSNYLTACRGAGVQPEDGTDLPDDASLEALFPLWPAPSSPSSGGRVIHVVGKDIAKFHAIYWPAFLLAAGIPPPHSIMTHAHFTVDHVKMSKSLGNVVDPLSLLPPHSHHAPDAIRYFLLREASHVEDSDFNNATVEQRAVKECAGTFGNLAHRVATVKFAPLGRLTLCLGRVSVPWAAIRQGGEAAGGAARQGTLPLAPESDRALQDRLDVYCIPPLSLLAGGEAALLPSHVSGHSVLAALPLELRGELWPEPHLGTLAFNDMQQNLLRMLADLSAKSSEAYAEGRAGVALQGVMAVLQEANRVHYENAPWKIAAGEADVQAWRAHAQAMVDRATGAVRAAVRGEGVSRLLSDSSAPIAEQHAALVDALGRVASSGALPPRPSPPTVQEGHMDLMAAVVSVLEVLRVSCILFQPAMPVAAPALLAHLGFDARTGGLGELRAPEGAAWGAATLGAVQPHHFMIGRPRGDTAGATRAHPYLSGPVSGPVPFPQPYEAKPEGKRKNALGGGRKGGKKAGDEPVPTN